MTRTDTHLETRYQDPSTSPGLMLWMVTNSWQRAIRAALSPYGLTQVQFVLLATLVSMDGDDPVRQRDLAERAGTDPMMTSQVLRSMEAAGLIVRTPHHKDRRAVSLAPTERGRSLANEANQIVELTDSSYFAPLGEEVMTLTDLLRVLAEPLDPRHQHDDDHRRHERPSS